jgi:modulator of FtsH protease
MEQKTMYQSASTGSVLETNKVLRNTYSLLAMTMVFSAVTAGVAMAMDLSHMAGLGLLLVAFGVMFVVNKKADSASGIYWVFGFTGLMGASLGPTLNYYLSAMSNGGDIIMMALGGTGLIFFSLSAYALTTKKDFSYMRGFLMVGLIVAVVAMVANIFLQIPALSLAISSAVIVIMSGFILYDTGRIINGGETNYIRATVSLYLNIYNIFVHLLSLLGFLAGDD